MLSFTKFAVIHYEEKNLFSTNFYQAVDLQFVLLSQELLVRHVSGPKWIKERFYLFLFEDLNEAADKSYFIIISLNN